jgi:hypothetical protein
VLRDGSLRSLTSSTANGLRLTDAEGAWRGPRACLNTVRKKALAPLRPPFVDRSLLRAPADSHHAQSESNSGEGEEHVHPHSPNSVWTRLREHFVSLLELDLRSRMDARHGSRKGVGLLVTKPRAKVDVASRLASDDLVDVFRIGRGDCQQPCALAADPIGAGEVTIENPEVLRLQDSCGTSCRCHTRRVVFTTAFVNPRPSASARLPAEAAPNIAIRHWFTQCRRVAGSLSMTATVRLHPRERRSAWGHPPALTTGPGTPQPVVMNATPTRSP